MRATARLRVVALLVAAIATVGAGGVPPVGAAAAASARLDGRLMIAHGDNFAGAAMVMQTRLQTASGIVPLVVPAAQDSQLMTLAGTRVRVVGSRTSSPTSSFAAASITPIATTASATPNIAVSHASHSMRIAVVLLRLPGSAAEPVTKASAQALTFGATNSVANWFSQMSGGQVAVTGTVYGYFNGVKSCDLAVQTSVAAAAAAGAGYVASDYDHLVVYAPSQVCGFKGMAWVGANGVFLNGTVDRGVIEHELGHNLGLLHAGLYSCGVAAPSAGCLVDYGDPTDVMGGTEKNRGYNAEHKYRLGWLPESEVKTVTTGTQTIALTASENPLVAGTTQLIHVRAADGTLFAVDRRASVGYDAGLSGVWIRQVADVKTDDTELMRNGALGAGQSFIDATHGVTFKTVSDSGATASIKVCVGACTDSVSASGTGTTAVLPRVTARTIVTGTESTTANTSLTMSVPTGRGVVVGHTVIVATSLPVTPGAVSCRDSRGNVYATNVDTAGAQRLVVCTAHVSSSLPPGATITVSYPAFDGAVVSSASDFAGIRATARVDKTAVGSGVNALVATASTTATTHAAEVVFGVAIHQGTPAFTASSVYTGVGRASFGSGASMLTITPAFRFVSTTGQYKFGGTLGGAAPWRTAILTLVRG